MANWNENIDEAPYMTELEVTNEVMDEPMTATRGYVLRGMVHEDQTFFTRRCGQLVCPTKWRHPS